MMNKEIFDWLIDNEIIITVSTRLEPHKIDEIYHIYNLITGESKEAGGCSKCFFNIIKRLRTELNKIIQKKFVVVYRTRYGNLSLKPQKEIAYEFIVSDNEELYNKLETMKQIEKNNNQQDV